MKKTPLSEFCDVRYHGVLQDQLRHLLCVGNNYHMFYGQVEVTALSTQAEREVTFEEQVCISF